MRIEANVSLNLGTKVEIKNLNSFRSVERAIEYELARQQEVLEQGGKIIQETRGFDENNGTTFSQRVKESSHDYRYFPDPDLPKLKLSEIAEFKNLRETLPELPWQKRERYRNYYQLPGEDIEQFVQNYELGLFFEHVARHFKENLEQVKLAANYILSDLVGYLKEDTKLKLPDPDNFAELIDLVNRGELSSRGAKDTLKLMLAENKPASEIAKKQGLFQQSDEGALWVIVDKVIAAHPGVVADFKRGKQAALQFLIGQGIKESKGAANPAVLKRLFESKFNS